jgi:hypothetical protein
MAGIAVPTKPGKQKGAQVTCAHMAVGSPLSLKYAALKELRIFV